MKWIGENFYKFVFWVFFGFVLPMSILVAVKNGVFNVSQIEITTDSSAGYDDYIRALKKKLSRFEGVNLWEVDLDRMEQVIQHEPWIKSVKIYRRYPHTLRVEVQSKTSVALLLSREGKMQILSADALLLPPISTTLAPKLPVIQDRRIFRDSALRDRVVKLLREMPETGRLSRESIGEVTINKSGEIWLEHLSLKTKIKLGEDSIALKSARVSQVLEYMEHNNLNGRVIDADFSKKVLVKLRNGR